MMVLLMVVCDIIPNPVSIRHANARGREVRWENAANPIPKRVVLIRRIFASRAPGRREARKMATAIAPSPTKLLRYPNVEASQWKIVRGYTVSTVYERR